MKNYNHVSESNRTFLEDEEQEMAVPLKSDSLKLFETLSLSNCNISKNAYQCISGNVDRLERL